LAVNDTAPLLSALVHTSDSVSAKFPIGLETIRLPLATVMVLGVVGGPARSMAMGVFGRKPRPNTLNTFPDCHVTDSVGVGLCLATLHSCIVFVRASVSALRAAGGTCTHQVRCSSSLEDQRGPEISFGSHL